jgi:nucleosome binding factor SPN SPT16 subunit
MDASEWPLLARQTPCLSSPVRYSVHLVDTVKVAPKRATLLTEGCKSPKETLFFINQEDKPAAKPAKAAKPAANGSPMKHKVAGGKMLRNKTRSAQQQEVLQTVVAKTQEHQRELHEGLQREGMAKYSEEGDGVGKNEGKSWKRFQSYKGEVALPKEVESLRVRSFASRSDLSSDASSADFR